MKHIVLGTAGHIDHGKTLLTRALTGVDTDRLAEEKARGISIELGFAPMTLPDGSRISIVDVPGHERFVKTMMAGASGIDGVLLTVAADDGVMPQTREHLDIICLLGVPTGLVALTKCDLVPQQRIAEVTEQIRELVRDTCLEGRPICPVSAVTGQGIPELRQEITRLIHEMQQRDDSRPARLPADRVFRVAGFGSIATGTLTEGTLHVGQEIEVYPQQKICRVRTIQVHNKDREEAFAGTRTALSFSHLTDGILARGCTLAETGSMLVADQITVRLNLTPDCPYRIRNSSQLHFFHGTEETVCRLRLLDAEYLAAGQSGYAQLSLQRPMAMRYGDRFLVRFFSPVVTVGGGSILACNDRRLKRHDGKVLERLDKLNSSSREESLLQAAADCGLAGVESSHLRLLRNESPEEFDPVRDKLVQNGLLQELRPDFLLAADTAETCLQAAVKLLQAYHETYSLQPGMPLAQLRSSLSQEYPETVDLLLSYWTENEKLKTENGMVSLPWFNPVFTQEHKIMQRKLMHYYREAWLTAPDQKQTDEKFEVRGPIYRQLLNHLRLNGMIVYLSPRYAVHFEAYEEALRIFRDEAAKTGTVTLGQFRTAAGISRKYSQLFLEYWDRRGITRRVGDAHVLTQKKSTDGESKHV